MVAEDVCIVVALEDLFEEVRVLGIRVGVPSR